MSSAGTILREARKKKRRSVAQFARQTRIKEKFLEALEASDWGVLPNLPIAQGFAKTYARALNVDSERVAALLRRDFPRDQSLPATKEFSLGKRLIWTPKTTVFTAAAVAVLVLAAYLIRQYLLFAASPPLEILKVERGDNTVVVTGKTSASATVEVDGRPVITSQDGTFSIELRGQTVSEFIKIKAISRAGKETVIQENIPE